MHSPWQKLKFFLQKKWEKIPDLDHTSEKVSNSKIILSKTSISQNKEILCVYLLIVVIYDKSSSELKRFEFKFGVAWSNLTISYLSKG